MRGSSCKNVWSEQESLGCRLEPLSQGKQSSPIICLINRHAGSCLSGFSSSLENFPATHLSLAVGGGYRAASSSGAISRVGIVLARVYYGSLLRGQRGVTSGHFFWPAV